MVALLNVNRSFLIVVNLVKQRTKSRNCTYSESVTITRSFGCCDQMVCVTVVIVLQSPPPISVPWPWDDPAPSGGSLISASDPCGYKRGSACGACWNSRSANENHVAAEDARTMLNNCRYCSDLSFGCHFIKIKLTSYGRHGVSNHRYIDCLPTISLR